MINTRILQMEVTIGCVSTFLPIEVDYRFTKGCRGRKDAMGVPIEPDTPNEIEIVAIRCRDVGLAGILPDSFLAEIEEELAWEHEDD